MDVGVDADPVAHLAAQELVNRQPQRLTGQVPKGDLDAGHGHHILTGLRTGEDSSFPQPLPQQVHIEQILSDQYSPERALDERYGVGRRIGRLAVAVDSLIGVNANMNLVAVGASLRRPDIRDLQLGPPVGRRILLDRRGQVL